MHRQSRTYAGAHISMCMCMYMAYANMAHALTQRVRAQDQLPTPNTQIHLRPVPRCSVRATMSKSLLDGRCLSDGQPPAQRMQQWPDAAEPSSPSDGYEPCVIERVELARRPVADRVVKGELGAGGDRSG